MSFSDKTKAGIAIYLIMYLVALAILTLEVFRLYGEIDQFFIQDLLTNLAAQSEVQYYLVLAIVPVFFFWFGQIALSQMDSGAKKQAPMCILVLIIFLIIGFYAILALIYMAVIFIGIYMSGVGSGLGGYDDAKTGSRFRKLIPLFGVIIGLFFELSYSGLLDAVLPWLKQFMVFPIPLQDPSPNPSGYGLGYYVTIASIMYSLISTVKESHQIRGGILGSGLEGRDMLTLVMNPLFLIFWVLSAVFLWPLLPFVLLNWGLALLYILGWVTGLKLTDSY